MQCSTLNTLLEIQKTHATSLCEGNPATLPRTDNVDRGTAAVQVSRRKSSEAVNHTGPPILWQDHYQLSILSLSKDAKLAEQRASTTRLSSAEASSKSGSA